jgi:NitT/TauT family transport system substrate-binding protein
MTARMRDRGVRRLGLATIVGAVVALALYGGSAASAPRATPTTEVKLLTLPIANTFPLDLGVKKGFFAAEGIEIKKTVVASGNDVILGLGNNNAEVGFGGFVPFMIGSTGGIPLQLLTASEVEGTSQADNWQNILVKGSSSIRTPRDLAGKTIAVNALKGVGEVMIKAAMQKLGVSPTSFRLTALPFPQMRSALNNGQVDAIWTPEPFLSQALNIDHARIVMAPGPVLGKFFPIGGYAAKPSWISSHRATAAKFRRAMNRSLLYAQSHPQEIREMLPAGTQNVRLPIWTTIVNRTQIQQLATYARRYDVITRAPNLKQLIPDSIASGLTLQGTVAAKRVLLRVDGKPVTKLAPGPYNIVVADGSKKNAFAFAGPKVNRRTKVKGVGRVTWPVNLRKGVYRYWGTAAPGAKKRITVG